MGHAAVSGLKRGAATNRVVIHGLARSESSFHPVLSADICHEKEKPMTVFAIFGVSVMMGFIAFGVVTNLYILSHLWNSSRENALIALIVPHAFRYVGLSFLVPGVVSPSLEQAFAAPAAYGDFCASILALIAIFALRARSHWAIPLVWLFNIWGFADLWLAMYQGVIGVGIMPGSLGAAFFIPTTIVPPLLITHGLIFWLLLRASQTVRT
jgi:hypothetical protein